jgi:hypothetical protein
MDLIARIADVIIPVFLIVAIGYAYARRSAPDMTAFNRIALDVLAPMLTQCASQQVQDFGVLNEQHHRKRRRRRRGQRTEPLLRPEPGPL